MISTSCLEKPPQNPAPAFPQLPQRRRRYPSHLKNKRGQFFQRRLTLMAAVEIRKKRGFPQPQGNSKSTQHFFYSPATISGVVRDATGGVVPGVSVTAR